MVHSQKNPSSLLPTGSITTNKSFFGERLELVSDTTCELNINNNFYLVNDLFIYYNTKIQNNTNNHYIGYF